MTAARYKAPSNFLALAGSRLGLDLLELFKEDEKGQQGFEGLAPTFKTTATTKGRGGVLGYKAPKMPTTVSEFSLMPEPTAVSATTPAPAPAPAPTPMPVKDTRPGIAATFGVSPLYFGHEDYWRNIERGYSPEEIKQYIQTNPQLLNPESSNVPGKGGLYDQIIRGQVDVLTGKPTTPVTTTSSQPAPQPKFENPLQTQEFVNAPSTPAARTGISTGYGISGEYFGGEDLEAAREAGYSDREIKEFLDKNISGLLREGNLPGRGGVYDQLRI